MDSALTFRAATAADVPHLVAVVESAYRGEASRSGWTTEADLLDGQRTDPEGVAAVIADPDSMVLVATDPDDQIVACCHIERHPAHAYFGLFAVRPTAQGGGVGRQVLAEAERIAHDGWGVPEMHMTVISVRNDLIGWYERRGYRRTGEMTPFPYGDERFGLPQRDDLQFELLVKPLR